jgi:hypothetical protein
LRRRKRHDLSEGEARFGKRSVPFEQINDPLVCGLNVKLSVMVVELKRQVRGDVIGIDTFVSRSTSQSIRLDSHDLDYRDAKLR